MSILISVMRKCEKIYISFLLLLSTTIILIKLIHKMNDNQCIFALPLEMSIIWAHGTQLLHKYFQGLCIPLYFLRKRRKSLSHQVHHRKHTISVLHSLVVINSWAIRLTKKKITKPLEILKRIFRGKCNRDYSEPPVIAMM